MHRDSCTQPEQQSLGVPIERFSSFLLPLSESPFRFLLFQPRGKLQQYQLSSQVLSPFSLLPSLCSSSCLVSSNLCFRDDIAAGSTSKNFSVDSLQPSSVYYLSFHTPTDNGQYFLNLQSMFSSSTPLISPLLPLFPPFSPFSLYYLSMNVVTEHEIPITTGQTSGGEGPTNNLLLSVLLPICSILTRITKENEKWIGRGEKRRERRGGEEKMRGDLL